MKICVFCSANSQIDAAYFQLTEELGRWAARNGHVIVFGGVNQGLMECLAKAVKEAGGQTLGVVPSIVEKTGRTSQYNDRVLKWETFMELGYGHEDEVETVDYSEFELAGIALTGGTTGAPKGVMFSNDGFNAVAMDFRYCGVEYDRNRLEQELIYYIEKLDISEEKQRLANHLTYFTQTMNDQPGQGKKLGFIAQEMGREINTTGSKSNNAEMQNIVVKMKDELEQIKEQVLNVL